MRDKGKETLVGQFFDIMENIRSRELDEEGKKETLFLSVRIINQLAYKRVCTALEKQELREFIWQMSDQELGRMMEILSIWNVFWIVFMRRWRVRDMIWQQRGCFCPTDL